MSCYPPRRQVSVGKVKIGGGAPITIQSMTKTDTRDVGATVAQILSLEQAGCDIVRVAVPDMKAASVLGQIKSQIGIPLVGDVHFDHRLALEAIRQGVDKLRLNPGNIREQGKVEQVVKAAADKGISIRVGANAGSLPPDVEEKHRDHLMTAHGQAAAMVEAALGQIAVLEGMGFRDIVISMKSFDVPATVRAYQMMAMERDYPLHVGITEAGLPPAGVIRSAVGIGVLLAQGLGDTVRVSLTADPVEEVRAAREILSSLQLRRVGITLISCPTCGRCEIDIVALARQVEERLADLDGALSRSGRSIRVALMGCVVNGPGEARGADVGIAGGRDKAIVYRHGQQTRVVPARDLLAVIVEEVTLVAGALE